MIDDQGREYRLRAAELTSDSPENVKVMLLEKLIERSDLPEDEQESREILNHDISELWIACRCFKGEKSAIEYVEMQIAQNPLLV